VGDFCDKTAQVEVRNGRATAPALKVEGSNGGSSSYAALSMARTDSAALLMDSIRTYAVMTYVRVVRRLELVTVI